MDLGFFLVFISVAPVGSLSLLSELNFKEKKYFQMTENVI